MATTGAIRWRCRHLVASKAGKSGFLSRSAVVIQGRSMSSTISMYPKQGDPETDLESLVGHAQPFVKVKLQRGHWDRHRTDPLTSPPWKSRARLVTFEDYINRPRVGFDAEFDTIGESFIALSWLDGPTADRIYDAYVKVMSKMGERTSHEYAMRVVAEMFNISSSRTAAVVELKHEEQQRKGRGEEVFSDLQELVDEKMKTLINDAYSEHDEVNPNRFVENPSTVSALDGEQTDMSFAFVKDDYDIDQRIKDFLIRDEERARLLIDGHIYREDIDPAHIKNELNAVAKKYFDQQKKLKEKVPTKRMEGTDPLPENGQAERRPRWKFVAQIVNTRVEKQLKKKYKRKYNPNRQENTIVEEDGEIRVATMADMQGVAWKEPRNPVEFQFQNAKKGWIDRLNNGNQAAWGYQEAPEIVETQKEEEKDTEEEDKDDETESDASEGDSTATTDDANNDKE